MGPSPDKRFERYHRALNGATWSSVAVSRVLFGPLVDPFVPGGPLVVSIDETLESRGDKKIGAKGNCRAAVRSGHTRVVKHRGPRWVCLKRLVLIPGAERALALPFLTALAGLSTA